MGLAVADCEEASQILDERFTRAGGASGVDVEADRKIQIRPADTVR
jgi:hypothetical protein